MTCIDVMDLPTLNHVYVASACNMLKIFHYAHVGRILSGANTQVLVHMQASNLTAAPRQFAAVPCRLAAMPRE